MEEERDELDEDPNEYVALGSHEFAALCARPDPAALWPLHPAELNVRAQPLIPALRACAARTLRAGDYRLPEGSGMPRTHGRRAARLSRMGKKAGASEDEDRLSDSNVDIDMETAADLDDAYLPPAVAECAASALDGVLAGLVAFRPKMTAEAREDVRCMGWESVLAAAAMGVDRR